MLQVMKVKDTLELQKHAANGYDNSNITRNSPSCEQESGHSKRFFMNLSLAS